MIALLLLALQDWDPSMFPLADGDLWVYRQTSVRDGKESSELRLKTARLHRDGVFRLDDPDGDDYLFSSDARGLLLHGEVKPDGEAVAFDPPLGYVTPELLKSGAARSTHKAGDRTIEASARLLGPAASRFEYRTGNRIFSIENQFEKGVGAVRRRFRLSREDGTAVFESSHELLAARVGGKVVRGGEDLLAALVFQHASAHREVFGPSFPGFVRRVRVREGEQAVAELRLEVAADGKITALEGERPRWAEDEIRSMVGHRRASPAPERKSVLKYAPAPGPRVGVEVEGDAMGSRYEVAEGVVRLVSRLDEGSRRFRIDVLEARWTSRNRYLATRFDVSFFDKEGTLREKREVTDVYAALGEDWIPERRTIRGGGQVRVFEFLDR